MIFHCHYQNGQHFVCATTDGRDHMPVPKAIFGKPTDAIRYAEMRNRNVQPLRSSVEPVVSLPAGSTEQPRGRSVRSTATRSGCGDPARRE